MEDGNPHDVDAACRVNRWPSADSRTGRFLCVKSEFIIPIYKKSAGICTCYSSRPTRPSHCPIQSERATQKPTPICIMTLECTFDRQRRTKDINIPRRHILLLCFGWILEFAKFCRAKNKTSSKRLFYICIFPTSLTSLRKYRRGKRGKDSNLINRTKIYSAIFSDVSLLLKKQTRNRLSVYLPWCKFFRTHHRPDGKI